MSTAASSRRLTEEEYLRIERAAQTRSEFWDGEMFAMAGGSPRHSRICVNLIRQLGNRLEGSGCALFNSDLRVKIEAVRAYTYPDVSIVCGEPQIEQGDLLVNPTVVVEVLSPSTEIYDRGQKSEFYRRIPSLREYLLVTQWKPHIEHYFRRPGGEWSVRDVAGLETALALGSLGIEVPLSAIYAGVDFAADK